jgi:4-amino-4-deoxy-L-arabinose transferase-like glycosyltransferase
MFHLVAATIILFAVSLSWAVVVDLVPASDRPYVDSTAENSVLELIFGHNGIERLINLRQAVGLDDRADGFPIPSGDRSIRPQGFPPDGNPPQPPAGRTLPQPPIGTGIIQGSGNGIRPNNQPGSMDFGTAGTTRLFTEPLASEVSWLLPLVIGGFALSAAVLWRRPFGTQHISLIFFALWLLPEAVYFTYSQGLMHAYYLIMMGPPIAALTATTIWSLWQIIRAHARAGWILAFVLTAVTLIFQVNLLWGKTTAASGALVLSGLMLLLGIVFALLGRSRGAFQSAALTALLAAMLVAPALWSTLTTFNSNPNGGLPYAGPSQREEMPGGAGQNGGYGNGVPLLAYLVAYTSPDTYLLATERASDSAPYILATGRPVLTFGGFLAEYDEVSVTQLAMLVKNGLLRFVLFGQENQRHQEISAWVQQNCTLVDAADLSGSGGSGAGTRLYDCGEK